MSWAGRDGMNKLAVMLVILVGTATAAVADVKLSGRVTNLEAKTTRLVPATLPVLSFPDTTMEMPVRLIQRGSRPIGSIGAPATVFRWRKTFGQFL